MLWQAGLVGDRSLARFKTGSAYRQLLVELLKQDYPLGHPVIIYRAATLPIDRPRIRHMALRDLAQATLTPEETIVLPPACILKPNLAMHERLEALDRQDKTDALA